MTLVEFLEARISEVEMYARLCAEAFPPPWDMTDRGHSARVTADEPHFPTVATIDQREAHPGRWPGEHLDHIARHDPARVLAECAAKRRIIETYVPDDADPHPGQPCTNDVEGDPDGERYAELKQWGEAGACVRHLAAWETHHHSKWVLKLLALPYIDHPDFDGAWRP